MGRGEMKVTSDPHSPLPYTIKGNLNAQLACRVLARHTVRGPPSGEESRLHFDRRPFAGARHYGDDGDLQRDSCGRARSVPLQGRGQLDERQGLGSGPAWLPAWLLDGSVSGDRRAEHDF